jgi:hypothetical protein
LVPARRFTTEALPSDHRPGKRPRGSPDRGCIAWRPIAGSRPSLSRKWLPRSRPSGLSQGAPTPSARRCSLVTDQEPVGGRCELAPRCWRVVGRVVGPAVDRSHRRDLDGRQWQEERAAGEPVGQSVGSSSSPALAADTRAASSAGRKVRWPCRAEVEGVVIVLGADEHIRVEQEGH